MRPDEAILLAICSLRTVAMNNTFQNDRDLAMRMSLRQRQVIISTALGLNIKAIGAALGISPKTVEYHKAKVRTKIGLACDADITRFAIRAGLVRP